MLYCHASDKTKSGYDSIGFSSASREIVPRTRAAFPVLSTCDYFANETNFFDYILSSSREGSIRSVIRRSCNVSSRNVKAPLRTFDRRKIDQRPEAVLRHIFQLVRSVVLFFRDCILDRLKIIHRRATLRIRSLIRYPGASVPHDFSFLIVCYMYIKDASIDTVRGERDI